MVDAVVSYLSMTVGNTPVAFGITLPEDNIQFRNVTKRSTKPSGSGTTRRYDLNFGTTDQALTDVVQNDIIPFEYNTADFDMNNEILFEDLVTTTLTTPLFFNVLQTSTSGTLHKSDLIFSTITGVPVPDIDVLVKRVPIDDLGTGTSNPFITKTILTADTFYGMDSNPVSRAGKIIAYDFVLAYLPGP